MVSLKGTPSGSFPHSLSRQQVVQKNLGNKPVGHQVEVPLEKYGKSSPLSLRPKEVQQVPSKWAFGKPYGGNVIDVAPRVVAVVFGVFSKALKFNSPNHQSKLPITGVPAVSDTPAK